MGRWWGTRQDGTRNDGRSEIEKPIDNNELGVASLRSETSSAVEVDELHKPAAVNESISISTEKITVNSSTRMPVQATTSSSEPTVIRAGLHLEGNIRTANDVLLEGSVRGEVSANSITISAGASLSGIVSATTIVVDGVVEGVIRCLKLQVNTTGSISGEIHHSILVVEAGAIIEGTVFRSDRMIEAMAPTFDERIEEAQMTSSPEAYTVINP
ncbi:hypothetical protein HYN69_19100 (plasmid) [Gemmobacter aquarius]|uniref:Protein CcmA, bactofilin family n=1 Tax=Paragemmobacter aquarius TaxID=2169400 RepID=A0A2S0USA3_9RHOB|nr:polymer-forming cytoskeletal protein [Gemmobacter aquarius]AWB50691.1 hypothetical protein HYN69_19100 [Gemmobacter aquarius]